MEITTIDSIKELLNQLKETDGPFILTVPFGESGEDYEEG